MTKKTLILKKREDQRIRGGHPWVYSNEIDSKLTPLKSFTPGEEVVVISHDKTLLGSAYVNPHALIAARLYSRESKACLNEQYFTQRLQQALDLRHRLYDQPYYRLVFSEADRLPGLVIDRFNQHLVVQVNTAGMDKHIDAIKTALLAVMPETESILLRNDGSMRKHEGLETHVTAAHGTPPDVIELIENGVRFKAPILTGQKTGWFYDHRVNRSRLKDYVRDAQVLDVFSYVGGWGVQAAVFGAAHVDCVDSSASACEFVTQNAALNQVEDKVTAICEDAFDAMKRITQEKKRYDVIILDPPAFVKRAKDMKEGLIAYQRLNEMALKLLVPGGVLFSCSCSMQVNMDELTNVMQRAVAKTQFNIQVLERGHQGPDHPIHIAIPETDYLKSLVVRKCMTQND